MLKITGYEIKKKQYESIHSLVFRARRVADGRSVMIKLLKEEYPSPQTLSRYRQEYEITKSLNIKGVPNAYEQYKYRNSLFMVLEDFDGESLEYYLHHEPLPLVEYLRVMISIASTLASIHEAGVIHKDINPSNIVYNRESGRACLIDFGISTKHTRENPVLVAPTELEGTLPYMSPEQTGRMNRSLDYRSDFYSFGATLYELLCGVTPFQSEEPVEMLHAHIAKKPKPPHLLNPGIPLALSAVVIKLLAKSAEERYRSAWGIESDLTYCLDCLEKGKDTEGFVPGQRDPSSRFHMPQKLYGRDEELQALVNVYEAVREGAKHLVLVSGYSGVGKTSLVRELHRPLSATYGYFIIGKYDQFQHLPHGGLVLAFRELIRQILTEPEEQIEYWRQELKRALGVNGKVISQVIPEVGAIIGEQMPLMPMGPRESANRFQMVFLNFIQVFLKKEQPLILFLDDLQWADQVSLNILQSINNDPELKYLMVIGAYRDNGLPEDLPLNDFVSSVCHHSETKEIHLEPLNVVHVEELLLDALQSEPKQTKGLAETVYKKTGGNPFYISQFLKDLYFQKQLVFQPPTPTQVGHWDWDAKELALLDATENVVDLVVRRLDHLPATVKDCLVKAACIGFEFDLVTLAKLIEKSPQDTYELLSVALEADLIQSMSGFEVLDEDLLHAKAVMRKFRFLHDRVHQAADVCLDEDERKGYHLKIGRILLQLDQLEDLLYQVVDHLNAGHELVEDEAEAIEIAKLNLDAGIRAAASMAYLESKNYLKLGLKLLTGSQEIVMAGPKREHPIWQSHYSLVLTLLTERAKVEYILGNFEVAKVFVKHAMEGSTAPVEKAKIYSLLLMLYTMEMKYGEAVRMGRIALALLGYELPNHGLKQAFVKNVTKLEEILAQRPIASLLDGKDAKYEEDRIAIQLLANIMTPAYLSDKALFSVIVTQQVLLSLTVGYAAESSSGFSAYGIILGTHQGRFRQGFDFGKLGLALSDKFNHPSQRARSCMILHAFLSHWCEHVKTVHILGEIGFRSAVDSGNLQWAGYIYSSRIRAAFYQGIALDQILVDLDHYVAFIARTQNKMARNALNGFRLVIRNLCGLTSEKLEFESKEINEIQYVTCTRAERDYRNLCHFHILKAQALYLYGQYAQAITHLHAADKLTEQISGSILIASLRFFQYMAICGYWDEASAQDQALYSEEMADGLAQMEVWAAECPENFKHKLLMMKAEQARMDGDLDQSLDLLEEAAQEAGRYDFLPDEALANELIAKIWLVRSKEKFAAIYLRDAIHAYRLWGARTKVSELEDRYFGLLHPHGSNIHVIFGHASPELSPTSLLKASRQISGEIISNRLIKRVLNIVAENTGSHTSYLLTQKDETWQIAAEKSMESDEVRTDLSIPIEAYGSSMRSIISYTARTQKSIIFNNPVQRNLFWTSPLGDHAPPQSVLCSPILHQGRLHGLFYLEHSLSTGAFTQVHLDFLELISAQVAISFDNARIYAKLEQQVRKRNTALKDALSQVESRHKELKLAQNQLIQSEKLAELGQLVAGLGHEINIPAIEVHRDAGNLADKINSLKVHLYSLAGPDVDPDIVNAFETRFKPIEEEIAIISNGASRISAIARDLRTFAGENEDTRQKVHVVSLLDQTLNLVKVKFGEQIEFERNYRNDPEIDGWPVQLNQVFMNLMINACQAIVALNRRKEENHIELATFMDEGMLGIRVKDNGCGIPDGLKHRIFDPFFTTKGPGEGTGLGLFISFKIVERHQGKIIVESEEGKGTCFSIYLPLPTRARRYA